MSKNHYNEEYYEEKAHSYLNRDIWTKNRIQNVRDMYKIKPDDIILDAGCGPGTFTFEFSKKAQYVIGLDLSALSLLTCKRLEKSFEELDNVNFIMADISNIPARDMSFTSIICADLIEHLNEMIYTKFIKEAYRILRNNSSFIIYTPNETHIFEVLRRYNIILKKDETHVGFKSMKYIIASLTNSDFVVESNHYKASHLPIFSLFEQFFMMIPIIGDFFKRRICVKALKSTDNSL